MTKSTPKQIVLLFVVLWALLISVFVMYILVPMLNERDETSEEIQNADDELTLLEHDAGMLGAYEGKYEELVAQLAEDVSVYYDIMKNSEADKMLLSLIEKNGCNATALGIENMIAVEDSGYITPYSNTPVTEETENASGKDNDDVLYTGIYVLQATYEMRGDYQDLLKVISAVNSDKSLAIASVGYEQDMEPQENEDGSFTAVEAGKDLPVIITILVFMFPHI